MNNTIMTKEDWDEIKTGPFIYSDDEEYFYECTRCKKVWDEYDEPKCICQYADEQDFDDQLISFEDHEEIIINLDKNKIKFKDKSK